MENKDTKLIREHINLIKSIENKIISENETPSLLEANPLGMLARGELSGVKIAAADLKPIMNNILNDAKLSSELTRIGVKSEKELFNLIKNDFTHVGKDIKTTILPSLNPKMAGEVRGAIELEILKSSTSNKRLLDICAENLVKDDRFRNTYKAYGNDTDFINELKKKGYSDQGAKAIAKKRNEFNAGTLKTASQQKKPITTTPVPPPSVPKKWFDELKIRLTQKKESWKKLLLWGAGIGIAGPLLWKMIKSLGGTAEGMPTTPPTDSAWLPCIQDLINNKSGQIVTTDSGQTYVFVQKTGNDEYDKDGGLKFFMNGRIFTYNNSKKGSWKCSGGTAEVTEMAINEQGTEVSAGQLQQAAKELDDQLSGDFFEGDSTDMQDALQVIKKFQGKTYRGKSATEVLKAVYKKIAGTDLVNDVKTKLKNLDFVGSEAQSDAITILTSQSSSTGGNNKANLSGIDITWDTENGGGNNDGGGNNRRGDKTKPKKSIYHDCTDFPFMIGCKSPKITEAQKCLGMPTKYQTGNFGPITKTAIENWGKETNTDLSYVYVGKENAKRQLVIDQKTYDAIMSKCNGAKKETDTNKVGKTPKVEPEKTDTTAVGTPTATTPTSSEEPKGETADELYRRLFKNKYLFGRLRGRRVVYKGPDLTKEEQEKLIQYMNSEGYRLSRENYDFRKGDKLVFKRNKAGYPESTETGETPSPEEIETSY